MSYKLKTSIIVFFILLLAFIFFMFRAELKNIEALKRDYTELEDKVYSYRIDLLKVWAVRLVATFLLPLIFLISGLSQKISIFAQDRHSLFVSGIIYGLIFFGIIFLINLPINFYSSYYLGHKYGLSNQTILRWLELNIKSFLVNDVVISMFLFIPFKIIYSSPNMWWFNIWLISIPVIVFIVFISPFVIDPIFNDYKQLEDGLLKEEITEILEKVDLEDASIMVVDKSKDTKAMNAYMTGIFSAKRIVLWDNTINNLETKEVVSITAHEIGHYVKGHIWKNILFGIVGSFVILYLLNISAKWILIESRGTFGFKNMTNFAVIPLLLILINLFNFLGSPIQNAVSREFERQADRYEISLTKDRESAASALKKLSQNNLGLPRASKFYEFWYYSHPSLEERIEFYMTEDFEEI
ncbi:MAG: M48 family metallopeptidase [Tissierellales bacterium]|nr:M48 family metallopeptidase [Tissierellales bacterium]